MRLQQQIDSQTILDLNNGDSCALSKVYSVYNDFVYQLGFRLLKEIGWNKYRIQFFYEIKE